MIRMITMSLMMSWSGKVLKIQLFSLDDIDFIEFTHSSTKTEANVENGLYIDLQHQHRLCQTQ